MLITITPHPGDRLGHSRTTFSAIGDVRVVNTKVNATVITEAFIGPLLRTSDGEVLGVCMRDSGFHLQYIVDGVTTDIVLNAGQVRVLG
jgi:hypothetical protein